MKKVLIGIAMLSMLSCDYESVDECKLKADIWLKKEIREVNKQSLSNRDKSVLIFRLEEKYDQKLLNCY